MEKLWESYGNSRNIILLHKVFHSSMKKCDEKPRPFFFFAMRNRCRDHSRHGSLGTTISTVLEGLERGQTREMTSYH